MYRDFIDNLGNQTDKGRDLKQLSDCQKNSSVESEFWQCIKDEVLLVEVQQAAGYDKVRDTSFNWTVIGYSDKELDLLIEFNEAIYVSSNAEPDVLCLKFIASSFFYDQNGLPIAEDTQLKWPLPLQLQLGTEADALKGASRIQT